jgi:hypothetical protein
LSSIISKNLLNNNEKIKLTKFAKFKNSGMGARMLYFTVTIQLCESLRCGGSLDLRYSYLYISNEPLNNHNVLKTSLQSILAHVFSIWIEASVKQLSDSRFLEYNQFGPLKDDIILCDLSYLSASHGQFIIRKIFQYMILLCLIKILQNTHLTDCRG